MTILAHPQNCDEAKNVMGNGRLLSRRTAGFPKVRTGRPDHGRTSHFDKQVGFSEEFLLQNQSLVHTI